MGHRDTIVLHFTTNLPPGFLSREIQTFVSGKKGTTTPHASRIRLADAARTAHYQIPGQSG
jgi:hypothetical protein